jgi:hypothetical protein
MAKKKSTSIPGAPKAKRALKLQRRGNGSERDTPSTELEKAEAYMIVHNGSQRPRERNAFVGVIGGSDTVNHVAKSLEFFSQLRLNDAGIEFSEDLQFGQYLILQTMVEALKTAQEQITEDLKCAHARGVIAAAAELKLVCSPETPEMANG